MRSIWKREGRQARDLVWVNTRFWVRRGSAGFTVCVPRRFVTPERAGSRFVEAASTRAPPCLYTWASMNTTLVAPNVFVVVFFFLEVSNGLSPTKESPSEFFPAYLLLAGVRSAAAFVGVGCDTKRLSVKWSSR